MLVVVLIIGILAAIAVPQYQNAVEKSRTAEAKIVLRTLRDAQARYYLSAGVFTSNISDLDIEIPASKYWTYTLSSLSAVATRNTSPNYLLAYRYSDISKNYAFIICRSDTDAAYGDKICKMLGAAGKDVDGVSWVLPL